MQSCQQERHPGRVQGGSSCEALPGRRGRLLGGESRVGQQWSQRRWPQRLGPTQVVLELQGRSQQLGGQAVAWYGRRHTAEPERPGSNPCPTLSSWMPPPVPSFVTRRRCWHLPRWFVMGHKRDRSRWKCPLHVISLRLPPRDRLAPFYRRGVSGMEGPLLRGLCSFPWCHLAHSSGRWKYVTEPSCPAKAAPLSTLSSAFL